MDIQIDPFLMVGAIICAVMAVLNGFRYKSRGVSAYILAVAFLDLGATMLLLRSRAPQVYIILGIALLIVLLGADLAARSAHQSNKDPRP